MQTTSALYKSIIAGGHRFEWKVVVNQTTTYGQDVIVRSVEGRGECLPRLIRQTFGENTPSIGNCIASEFTVTLMLASSAIPRMAMIEPYFRAVNGTQNSDWYKAGEFFIDTRKEDEESGTLFLDCYDAMLKANGAGGKTFLTYMQERHGDELEWPISMSYALSEIASIIDVSVDARTSINSGAAFQIGYPNDYTMREILSYIAVAHGGSFVITYDGKLLLVPLIGFNTTTIALAKNMTDLKVASAFAAWSKVTIYYGDEDAYEAGNNTGRSIDGDDPWAEQGTANSVLSLISGSSYQPFSADSVILDPAAEIGDKVSFTKGSTTLYSNIWSCVFVCNEYATATVEAPGEDEVDHEYPYVSSADRKMKRMVKLGQPYYGVTITKTKGIEIKRSDGASEAIFNSDQFTMRALIDGIMKDRIYFDPLKGDYVFDGALGADAVFTDSLYAERGDIAELTVDQLSTSGRVKKYFLRDYSDDNFVFIKDQFIQFVTGTIVSSTGLQTEDGDFLLTESGYNLTEETGNVATVQISNRYGQLLYWQREPVSCTADGYPLDEDGQQVYASTMPSSWPVVTFKYTELVKAQQAFEQGGLLGNYIPQSIYGAGDEHDNSKGYIFKDETSFKLRYVSSRAKNVDLVFTDDGFVDAMHRRLTSCVLDTSTQTLLYTMEGDNHLYTLAYSVSGDTVTYTWPDGHSCSITIPDDWGDGGEGGGGSGGSGPSPATNTPYMDGTATAGALTTYARGDHVHPTDTSRAALSDIPAAYTGNPVMDGTASPGSATTWAKGDHVHPHDTSRASATDLTNHTSNTNNPHQVTAAQVGAYVKPSGGIPASDMESGAIPAASSATPLVDGTAAVGSSTDYARGDHVHPTDTSRRQNAPVAVNLFNGSESVASDKTISLTGDYADYAYLALLFNTDLTDNTKRMLGVLPVRFIIFQGSIPLANTTESGAIRIIPVTGQDRQLRFHSTNLSNLTLLRIDGIK